MTRWRADLGEPDAPGELAVYPSRAQTGRYLLEQAGAVLSRLAEVGLPVRHTDRPARRVHRHEDARRWWVDDDGPYDEVLLASGHTTDWPGALRHTWSSDLPPLQPRAFPVCELLAREEIRPGATVLVRGAGLTGLDTALALTRGRGRSVADSDLRIILVSRSGRLMVPKSPADLVRATHGRAGDARQFVARAVELVRAGRGEDLPLVLRDLAVHLLAGAAGVESAQAQEQVDAVLTHFRDGAEPAPALDQLRSSVAVAQGQAPPDGTWAVGQAWRGLQADLARVQQEVDPDAPTLGWPDYAPWGAELERLGYGPSLMHAEFLLAGLEAGNLEIRRGDTTQLARQLAPNLVVDAVLPPPGVRDLPADDVLAGLIREGWLTVSAGSRGARVAPAAEVLGRDRQPVPGLSLIGRAAEGVVLATDTLLRDMHPAVDLWAQRVLGLTASG